MSEFHNPLEIAFQHDLEKLRGVYASQTIIEAAKNADLLIELYEKWQDALTTVASVYSITDADLALPESLEAASREKLGGKVTGNHKTILGLAGPGATGKETLAKALGYPKVISTTTRPQREYELDGIHYHFVNEEEFAAKEKEGEFVSVTNRPGRGQYGIQHDDLKKGITQADAIILEENPATLTQLEQSIKETMPETHFLLTYILPPDPVQPHLALRLAQRCLVAGEEYRAAIQSTLGQRQIDEFLSLIPALEQGAPVLFVVNDSVERAINVIQSVITPDE